MSEPVAEILSQTGPDNKLTATSQNEQIIVQERSVNKQPLFFLRRWLQVLPHTHSKLVGLFDQPDFLQNWQDGQLTTKKLIEAVQQINLRNKGMAIVDSDHAAHALDEYHPTLPKFANEGLAAETVRQKRADAFKPENLIVTINKISLRLDARRRVVEVLRASNPDYQGQIFTGVEADLLNADGKIDVNADTLSKMDYVGVSFHVGEWRDCNDDKEPTRDEIVRAYEAVAINPNIDVLNHFLRELPKSVLTEIQAEPECFDKLFANLAKNNKALEINLRDLVDPRRQVQNQLIIPFLRHAKDLGVKFVIGTDFHRVEQYLPTQLNDGRAQLVSDADTTTLRQLASNESFFSTTEEFNRFEQQIGQALQQVFEPEKGAFGLPKNFTSLLRPVYLAVKQLALAGIDSSDVLNSDKKKFADWIEQRRQQKNPSNQ